ncbi:MAG: DUF4382 domain-containing protein [Bacteroidetes bacterium]|nr:DUF4382 domain-containing protein [Bacteroidota bacterium]
MKKISNRLSIGLFLLLATFASCHKDVVNQVATLSVSLKDSPGNYNNVFVQVVGVEIHTNTNGWQTLPVDSAIYDLLTLQNDVDTVLVTPQSIPSGSISQIRLILGDSNIVVVDSVAYPLELSSEDETGLKCNLHSDLMPNTSYHLMLDFDANASIVANGNGTYKLKPVVTAFFQ